MHGGERDVGFLQCQSRRFVHISLCEISTCLQRIEFYDLLSLSTASCDILLSEFQGFMEGFGALLDQKMSAVDTSIHLLILLYGLSIGYRIPSIRMYVLGIITKLLTVVIHQSSPF